MARTQVGSGQIGDGQVKRADLNIADLGDAVVRKIIAGTGLDLTSTGVDAGTGDVTLSREADSLAVTLRLPHGFAVKGSVETGEIPGFFVSVPTGQTASIALGRYACESGTATFSWRKNGTNLTDLTGLSMSSTAATTDENPDVALADGDYIDMNVTAASSLVDLRATLFVDYTRTV